MSAGVTSQVAEVRGMALDTIAKMVKAAGPAQIQPHLADLSVTMLESLSGMEVCLINTHCPPPLFHPSLPPLPPFSPFPQNPPVCCSGL